MDASMSSFPCMSLKFSVYNSQTYLLSAKALLSAPWSLHPASVTFTRNVQYLSQKKTQIEVVLAAKVIQYI